MPRKQKRKQIPDAERCLHVLKSGSRCEYRWKDGKYCGLHPDKAKQNGSKGGTVTSERRQKLKRLAAGWRIGKSFDTFIEYTEGKVAALEEGEARTDRGKKLSPIRRDTMISMWLNHMLRAMDAKHRHKAGGKLIALILQTVDGKTTRWPLPPGERPEPTEFEGGDQQFNPPREGEA